MNHLTRKMKSMNNKPFWKSKKFWTMALGAAATVVASVTGFTIPAETIALVAAYIVGQGLADGKAAGKDQ